MVFHYCSGKLRGCMCRSIHLFASIFISDHPIVNASVNSACCYFPERNYILRCNISGYPPPDNITWSWKPYCFNATSNCNSSTELDRWETFDKFYSVNNSTVGIVNRNRNLASSTVSSLAVVATETGYYKCIASNRFGTSEDEFMFIVSGKI